MQDLQKTRSQTLISTAVSLALTLLLTGCASTDEIPPLQKHVFSDDYLYDGVRFYAGPWYAPGRSFAYEYSGSVMILSDSHESGYVVQALKIEDCAGLSNAYDELIESIAETVDYATGRESVTERDFWITDGSSYSLQYHAAPTWTRISLEGGPNAEITVPWVYSAIKLREIATGCADSKN